MRDTARPPQPTTNPPLGHQMRRQGLAQNDQKYQFRAKFGRFWAKNPNFYWRKQKFWYPHNGKTTQAPCSHWFLAGHRTKWAKNANIWPKKPTLGQIWPFMGQKILIFKGVSKSFGTHWTRKPHRQLVWIVFWSGIGSNGRKLAVFGPKIYFFGGME